MNQDNFIGVYGLEVLNKIDSAVIIGLNKILESFI